VGVARVRWLHDVRLEGLALVDHAGGRGGADHQAGPRYVVLYMLHSVQANMSLSWMCRNRYVKEIVAPLKKVLYFNRDAGAF